MVDAELYDSYRTALGACADMAKACVENLMENYSGSLTKAELTQVYQGLVKRLGTYAAQVALEFYRAQRELSQAEGEYEAKAYAPNNAALLAYDAANSTARQLPGIAVQRVLTYADETIYRNGAADPARPRYSVVPHPGACGWCLMVGANAWFYGAKSSAENQRHPNCKCTVVADFDHDNPSLAGYDPAELAARYDEAYSATSGDIEDEWRGMTREERERYARKKRSAYDVFKTKRIVAEMTRRSRT